MAPGAFRRAFTAAITAGIDPGRVQWSKVVDYIELFGGYRFGVTTCKRKFVAVMSRGLAENADENNNHDGGNDMGVNGVADE